MIIFIITEDFQNNSEDEFSPSHFDNLAELQRYQGIDVQSGLNSNMNGAELTLSDYGLNSSSLNYNVHVFYYPWYGTPEFDGGKYLHWNHEYLQHWEKRIASRYPKGDLTVNSHYTCNKE